MTKRHLRHLKLDLPRWVAALYAAVAVVLLPWTVVLAATLPARHFSHHWDMAWAGFDTGMLLMIILTAVLLYRRSWWVCLTAMSVFTFLIIDGWFDVLTSRPGEQMNIAILMAVFVELPLAAVSLWLAYRVAKELVNVK